MKIKTLILGSIIGLLTLAGCHESPLKTQSKDNASRVLVQASKYAEEKAGHPQHARGYFDCMRGKQKVLNCDQLYNDMAEHAQKQDDFEKTTAADLKNKDTFNRIKDMYEERLFFVF